LVAENYTGNGIEARHKPKLRWRQHASVYRNKRWTLRLAGKLIKSFEEKCLSWNRFMAGYEYVYGPESLKILYWLRQERLRELQSAAGGGGSGATKGTDTI